MLHAWAQGGAIHFERLPNGKIARVRCHTRDGYVLEGCPLPVFERLKRRRLIKSVGGRPYRVTHAGLRAVNAQHDNR